MAAIPSTTSASTLSQPAGKLARVISGPLLFLLILGGVLGAGVYVLVGKIADNVGGAA